MPFLDEADEPAPPLTTRFAAPGHSASVHRTKPFQFCDTCQLNQHKYATSLAQLDAAEDDTKSQSQRRRMGVRDERARLEQLYPQVCKHCAAGAYEQIVASQKLARQDYLRKKLTNSTPAGSSEISSFSVLGAILPVFRLLWFLGLAGQIAWNLANIIALSPFYETMTQSPWFSAGIMHDVISTITSRRWARSTLLLSIASSWYSPYFSHARRGFWFVVEGFDRYYAGMFGLLLLRTAGYFVLTSTSFSQTLPGVAQLTHGFELVVVVVFASRTFTSVQKNNLKLFDTQPQSFTHIGPARKSQAFVQPSQDATIRSQTWELSPPSTSRYGTSWTKELKLPLQQQNTQGWPREAAKHRHNSEQENISFATFQSARSAAFDKSMSLSESVFSQRMNVQPSRTLLATHVDSRNSQSSEDSGGSTQTIFSTAWPNTNAGTYDGAPYSTDLDEDMEMDWEPVNTGATEFKPRSPESVLVDSHLTNVGETMPAYNPFRTRVPAAVLSPAQRARNPPRQPAVPPVSKERKDVFLNNMLKQGKGSLRKGQEAREINLKPQTFFYSEPGGDLGDELAASFTSTSFFQGANDGHSPAAKPQSSAPRVSRQHLAFAAAYLVALLFCQCIPGNGKEIWASVLALDILCLLHGLMHIWSTGNGNIPFRDQRRLFGGGEAIAAGIAVYCMVAQVGSGGAIPLMAWRAGVLGIMLAFESYLYMEQA